MSNEPEGPATSLEDDPEPGRLESAPPAAPPAASAQPIAAAAPAPAVPPEEPDEDLTDPELAKDSQRVTGLLAELSRKRQENKLLKADAARLRDVEQELADMRPYAEFVRNNPQLLQPREPEPAPRQPTGPAEDPDAVEAAQLMDFYTADGKPDVAKGARWLALQDRRAGKVTREAIQPYAVQTAQEKSNANFQRALQIKDAAGRSPSPEALGAVWQEILKSPDGLRIVSDERAAAFLAITALGMDGMTKKPAPAPPASPPLVTEASGGHPRTRPSMSALEERIARDRGMNDATWKSRTEGFTPGRPSVIEE